MNLTAFQLEVLRVAASRPTIVFSQAFAIVGKGGGKTLAALVARGLLVKKYIPGHSLWYITEAGRAELKEHV